MKNKNRIYEIEKFLFSGGISAALNIFSRFMFQAVFSFFISVLFASCVGVVSSFLLNRYLTFKASEGDIKLQALKFGLAGIGYSLLCPLFASVLLKWYEIAGRPAVSFGQMETAAHIISIGFGTIYSYFSMKLFSFKE
jgi:putative flippase GtrA